MRAKTVAIYILIPAGVVLVSCGLVVFTLLNQINSERERCMHTPQNELLDSGDYQYCLNVIRGINK